MTVIQIGNEQQDATKWLRVTWPGIGGRNIQLSQLAEIMADDDRWESLCELASR